MQELDIKNGLDNLGIRTNLMGNYWGPAGLNKETNEIFIGKKKYTAISRNVTNFSTQLIASLGSSNSREILILNPDKSPLLDEHYQNLKKQLQDLEQEKGELSYQEIFKTVGDYVKEKIFFTANESHANNDRLLEKIITNKKNKKKTFENKKNPIISIEKFIKKGAGVCRHHSLVTANLLDRLTKEKNPLLKGHVYQVRSNFSDTAAHTWNTFVVENQEKEQWHIDSFWGFETNLKESEAYLKRQYGKNAIDLEKNITRKEEEKEEEISPKQLTVELVEKNLIENVDFLRIFMLYFNESNNSKTFFIKESSQKGFYTLQYCGNEFRAEFGTVSGFRFQVLEDGSIDIPQEKSTYNNFEDVIKAYKLGHQVTSSEAKEIEEALIKRFSDRFEEDLMGSPYQIDFEKKYSSRNYKGLYFIRKSTSQKDHYVIVFVKDDGKVSYFRFKRSAETGQIQKLKDNTEIVERSYDHLLLMVRSLNLSRQITPSIASQKN